MIDPTSVAFDIDGVIADTMSLFLEIARDEFNINGIRYEDLTCYNLVDCVAIDPDLIDAVVERILNGNYTQPLRPIDGASKVISRIAQHHSPVLFVTARPHLGPIRDWICDLLPLDPQSIVVVTTGSFEFKAEVLLAQNISVFVEDRLETCYHLQDVGVLPILFKQPWNREPHPFVEVGTWEELEALIEF
jgi:5'(3')-deoxyribonucleotidase